MTLTDYIKNYNPKKHGIIKLCKILDRIQGVPVSSLSLLRTIKKWSHNLGYSLRIDPMGDSYKAMSFGIEHVYCVRVRLSRSTPSIYDDRRQGISNIWFCIPTQDTICIISIYDKQTESEILLYNPEGISTIKYNESILEDQTIIKENWEDRR